MKCDQCGYVSFDHNLLCPSCGSDLTLTRTRLEMNYEPPEADFSQLFRIQSSSDEIELELAPEEDDFEFILDD